MQPEELQPLESTLALVYMAVRSTVNSLTYTSARDLRMDLIKALLGPSQNTNSAILQQLGITDDQATCRRLRPSNQSTIPSSGLPAPEQTRELYNPGITSILPRAGGKKTLRMLQCIKEVGSAGVLGALKVAAVQPRELLPTEGPSYLLKIHHFLDEKAASNHLDVARTRFVKHCYFNAFDYAVGTLAMKKRESRIERKKMIKEKPATDWICKNYPNIDHTQPRHSEWIVREAIAIGMQIEYGWRTTDSIKENLKRYLTEGATLSLILQGLDPALLVLFPGNQQCNPCLSYENLEDTAVKARLGKFIEATE
jgi:hypothetical protein